MYDLLIWLDLGTPAREVARQQVEGRRTPGDPGVAVSLVNHHDVYVELDPGIRGGAHGTTTRNTADFVHLLVSVRHVGQKRCKK